MVSGEEHCAALVSECTHHAPESLAGLNVHSGGRLVKDYGFGITRDRDGEADPLGLAAREAVGPPPQELSNVRSFDDLVTRCWPALQTPDKAERLVDADTWGEANARAGLEHGTHSPSRHRMAWIAPENLDTAFLGSDETEQRRDGGRLAGTVRSEQRKHLAPRHVQVQPVESNVRSIAVGHASEGQRDRPRQGECARWCCYQGRQGNSPAAHAALKGWKAQSTVATAVAAVGLPRLT
jgi:hypothetical protein